MWSLGLPASSAAIWAKLKEGIQPEMSGNETFMCHRQTVEGEWKYLIGEAKEGFF